MNDVIAIAVLGVCVYGIVSIIYELLCDFDKWIGGIK